MVEHASKENGDFEEYKIRFSSSFLGGLLGVGWLDRKKKRKRVRVLVKH